MPRFLVFTWKTHDELIEEALIDPEIGERNISKFTKWLKTQKGKRGKPMAGNTAHSGSNGYMRCFYSHNKVNTHNWNNPKCPPSRVKQTDAENPLWLIEKNKHGKLSAKLNRSLLQELFARLNFRDQIMNLS